MRTKGTSSVKEIYIGVGRTYNIGNYESVKLQVGCTLTPDPIDHPEDTVQRANRICTDSMEFLEQEWGVDKK